MSNSTEQESQDKNTGANRGKSAEPGTEPSSWPAFAWKIVSTPTVLASMCFVFMGYCVACKMFDLNPFDPRGQKSTPTPKPPNVRSKKTNPNPTNPSPPKDFPDFTRINFSQMFGKNLEPVEVKITTPEGHVIVIKAQSKNPRSKSHHP